MSFLSTPSYINLEENNSRMQISKKDKIDYLIQKLKKDFVEYEKRILNETQNENKRKDEKISRIRQKYNKKKEELKQMQIQSQEKNAQIEQSLFSSQNQKQKHLITDLKKQVKELTIQINNNSNNKLQYKVKEQEMEINKLRNYLQKFSIETKNYQKNIQQKDQELNKIKFDKQQFEEKVGVKLENQQYIVSQKDDKIKNLNGKIIQLEDNIAKLKHINAELEEQTSRYNDLRM